MAIQHVRKPSSYDDEDDDEDGDDEGDYDDDDDDDDGGGGGGGGGGGCRRRRKRRATKSRTPAVTALSAEALHPYPSAFALAPGLRPEGRRGISLVAVRASSGLARL